MSGSERSRETQAIAAVLVAVLVFSVIELLIKDLAKTYPLQEVVGLRVLSSLPLLFGLFWYEQRHQKPVYQTFSLLRPQRPWLHVLRCVLAAVSMSCIFYAVANIPLGTAAALTSTSPLFLLAVSPWLLGESVSWYRWLGVFIGFVGVCLIASPSSVGSWMGMVSALLGAATSAGVAVCLRKLASRESAAYTSLINAIGLSLLAVVAMLVLGALPLRAQDWPAVGLLGLLGATGHFIITWSYRHAAASVLAPLGFTASLWATWFGYWLWDEVPQALTVLGMAAIMGGGFLATRR